MLLKLLGPTAHMVSPLAIENVTKPIENVTKQLSIQHRRHQIKKLRKANST